MLLNYLSLLICSHQRQKPIIIMVFLIPTLVEYVQIQSQSKETTSPSDDNWLAQILFIATLVSICLYAVGLIAESRLESSQHNNLLLPIIKFFTPFIGYLVVVLLLLNLIPIFGIVAFILWTLLMLKSSIKVFHVEALGGCFHGILSRRGQESEVDENPSGVEQNRSEIESVIIDIPE